MPMLKGLNMRSIRPKRGREHHFVLWFPLLQDTRNKAIKIQWPHLEEDEIIGRLLFEKEDDGEKRYYIRCGKQEQKDKDFQQESKSRCQCKCNTSNSFTSHITIASVRQHFIPV